MIDLAVHLAKQVRDRRQKLGITQAELASRSSVTVETVARLERVLRGRASANANPSLETLESIAHSLGCEAHELLAQKVPERPGDKLDLLLKSAPAAVRRRATFVIEALLKEARGA